MSASIKSGPPAKLGQSSLPAAPNSQAILLDKLNRRSTPDSEALASSDDEGDAHRPESLSLAAPQPPPPKPVRRASWLNDTSSQGTMRPRNESFASASMSPTSSHPTLPTAAADVGVSAASAWNAHPAPPTNVINRAHSASAAFSWGTGIWNNDRKDASSRLAEVLPSPTSAVPPGSAGSSFFGADTLPQQTSPGPRDQGAPTSQIPFAIPLHPTPKTYRSQSYSVGQLDPETTMASAAPPSSAVGNAGMIGSRVARPITHSGLQHRPSRPSMLSEMSSDGGMLGKVKEVDDDDDESTNDSLQGSQQLSVEAKTIEMLARENAILRQQASQQYHNARLRPRASTAAAYGLGNGYGLQESVPEETSDYAIDELDEINDGDLVAATKRAAVRRMSEFAAAGSFRSPFSVENRKLENVKKAFWQSSPGFSDISPSRRHSFADIPTRQASISSIGEVVHAHDGSSQDGQPPSAADYGQPFSAAQSLYSTAPNAASAVGSQQSSLQHPHQPMQQAQLMGAGAYGAGAYSLPYGLHAPPFAARPTSPQRGLYGMTQPNRSTPLHIVLFKCARADVFYIQEGTGLTVKPGDLVIVEADRGTDLGTVAVDNVDWVEARRLKEHYAEEQYKWLMMYSQNTAATQEGVGVGLMASSAGLQGSAIGGMGPPGPHHMQEPNAGELKPKLIKRLAQNHEIHALRDKEGNEAKAKRVCMQKVKEHGLNMEILDAEFQMDWKKLTFYYFADAYINFNSLVTDLFKIYKTRIWMSAINPASFASQPLGLQAPSGIGPGAVGVGRGTTTSDRRQNQQPDQQPSPQSQPSAASVYASAGPAGRGFQGGLNAQPASAAAAAAASAALGNYPSSFAYGPYAAFGSIPRAPGLIYGQGGIPTGADSYPVGYPQTADYNAMRTRYPVSQPEGAPQGSLLPLAAQGDWTGAFQGLSLNSR